MYKRRQHTFSLKIKIPLSAGILIIRTRDSYNIRKSQYESKGTCGRVTFLYKTLYLQASISKTLDDLGG